MQPTGQVSDPVPDPAGLVLHVVDALVRELRPGARVRVHLDSDLEGDLGLDSLAVAELLARVEDALDTRLPTSLLGLARTPRDLLEGAGTDEERGASRNAVPAATPAGTAVERPTGLATLLESLEWHVATHPDRVHAIVLGEDGQPTSVTYGQLHARAIRIADGLRAQQVVPGDAVALMLPPGVDYLVTFIGVWLAGAVAVPVYPPDRPDRLAEHLRRQSGILGNAEVSTLVTVPEGLAVSRIVRTSVGTLRHVCTVEQLSGTTPTGGSQFRGARSAPDHLALLQYTSGSTGDPKGVMLRHSDLIANIDAMVAAIHATAEDVFVSWLPMYHDMGLIGAWLGSLHVGMALVLMPPQEFIVRPITWLRAISDHGGTLAAAPNFAYELCLKRVTDEQLAGLDLSTWRYAFNGAEAVSPSTLRRFADRFAAAGLRPESIAPCYGLAEAALGLTFPPPDRGPIIDRIQRRALREDRRAVPAGPDDDAVELAACGVVVPGYALRVVDDRGRVLPPRHEGHLQFQGPSATTGYIRNPEATAGLFDDGWLRTGDLAYMAEDDLVITGRAKDLIIRAGHNLHPQELEERVGAVDGVRAGCVVAVGVPDEMAGTERLVVIAETRTTDADEQARIRSAVAEAAAGLVGDQPDEVLLVGPGRVPKTSSGKLRRAEARTRYLEGRISRRPAPPWAQLADLALRGVGTEARRILRHRRDDLRAARGQVVFRVLSLMLLVVGGLLPGWPARAALVRATARLGLRLVGVPVEVSGAMSDLPGGGAVVVANHGSWLDGIVLAAILPGNLRFMAAEVLAGRTWVQGMLLRRLGAVFVERGDRAQGVADASGLSTVVRPGDTLVVFPEGRLDALPGLRPFHLGAFRHAAEEGIPMVPIAIRGARQIVPPGTSRLRRGQVEVHIGAPIQPEGSAWTDVLSLRDAAHDQISGHCGEPERG